MIYLLCAAPSTSEQTLRYLRSTYDFIYAQLRPLPTAASCELPQLRHLTWLLRLLALELKVGAPTGAAGQAAPACLSRSVGVSLVGWNPAVCGQYGAVTGGVLSDVHASV